MRYQGDQNKVVILAESGTYATSSGPGIWPGLVTSSTITDAEGKLETRYLGAATRSFSRMEDGPRDVTGTISMYPQNWRFLAFAIGSNVDTSGLNSTHVSTMVENGVRANPWTSGTLNPPISFTIEDSKVGVGTGRNFLRTVNGCTINSVTLNGAVGERLTMDIDWIGKTDTFSSGTTTSVTASTVRPYMWNDCTMVVDGITMLTPKSFTLTVANNAVGPHYLDASRDISVPYFGNRDLTMSITIDADTEVAKNLYDKLWRGGSIFDASITISQTDAIGSQYAKIVLSGCEATACGLPSPSEGINEMTFEMKAPIIIGSFMDRFQTYGYW